MGVGKTVVGFIGLGTMGCAMAAQLVQRGHRVSGNDVNAQAVARLVHRGGELADTPADAARHADVLVVMVHDAAQAEHVLFGPDGAAASMRRGSVVWLASTVMPAFARGLAPRLSERGLLLVDGPVSGGMTGAESGRLTIIASGSTEALEACAAVMDACASRVFRVGNVGAGSTVKMINQLLVAAHVALTAEALALGAAAGVSRTQLIEVITHSAGSSKMFEKRAPRIAAGDHAPHTTVNTLLKDLRIALDTARDLGMAVPIAATAQSVFMKAASAGHGAHSDTTIVHVYEAWAQARVV